jgi:hypothetical protein
MRILLTNLILAIFGQCFASTLQKDTVDNWKIYNGKELVFYGYSTPLLTNFKGTINHKRLKDIEIKYNHCIPYNEQVHITVKITDDNDNCLLISVFEIKHSERIIIRRKNIKKLPRNESLKIKYSEDYSLIPHMLTLGVLTIE